MLAVQHFAPKSFDETQALLTLNNKNIDHFPRKVLVWQGTSTLFEVLLE